MLVSKLKGREGVLWAGICLLQPPLPIQAHLALFAKEMVSPIISSVPSSWPHFLNSLCRYRHGGTGINYRFKLRTFSIACTFSIIQKTDLLGLRISIKTKQYLCRVQLCMLGNNQTHTNTHIQQLKWYINRVNKKSNFSSAGIQLPTLARECPLWSMTK